MAEKVVKTWIQGGGVVGDIVGRSWSGQRRVYKNPEAFYHAPSELCYVPEDLAGAYTANGFFELSLEQPEIAEEMFQSVEWEHPETWLDEQFRMGELAICPVCGHICQSYVGLMCPYCRETNCEVTS